MKMNKICGLNFDVLKVIQIKTINRKDKCPRGEIGRHKGLKILAH
jgi:hypothetical protein